MRYGAVVSLTVQSRVSFTAACRERPAGGFSLGSRAGHLTGVEVNGRPTICDGCLPGAVSQLTVAVVQSVGRLEVVHCHRLAPGDSSGDICLCQVQLVDVAVEAMQDGGCVGGWIHSFRSKQLWKLSSGSPLSLVWSWLLGS